MAQAPKHHLPPAARFGCTAVTTLLGLPATLLTWYLLVNTSSSWSAGEIPAALIAGAFLGLCVGGPWAWSRSSWRPLAWTVPVSSILTMCWILLWEAGALR